MREIIKLNESDMEQEIRADLRIARTRSGLSNKDVAHLLGCTKDRVSRLENGMARLKLGEVAGLYLIYGLPFEETFKLMSGDIANKINDRLCTVPQEPVHWAGKRISRISSLDRLSQRLQDLITTGYDN